MTTWHLYIVRCSDGSLYTGIATNVRRRLAQHEQGSGAKYLRGRAPLVKQLSVRVGDHGAALRLEYRIKQLSRAQKEDLVLHPRRVRAMLKLATLDKTGRCAPSLPKP
jgi:putative endonuclease